MLAMQQHLDDDIDIGAPTSCDDVGGRYFLLSAQRRLLHQCVAEDAIEHVKSPVGAARLTIMPPMHVMDACRNRRHDHGYGSSDEKMNNVRVHVHGHGSWLN